MATPIKNSLILLDRSDGTLRVQSPGFISRRVHSERLGRIRPTTGPIVAHRSCSRAQSVCAGTWQSIRD